MHVARRIGGQREFRHPAGGQLVDIVAFFCPGQQFDDPVDRLRLAGRIINAPMDVDQLGMRGESHRLLLVLFAANIGLALEDAAKLFHCRRLLRLERYGFQYR